MDEQRQHAYLTLITALLTCPNSEEGQILQDNAELVDAGLVETMAQVAEALAERGDENAAQFLIGMANQLGEFLGLSDSTATPEAQLRFLLEVLQATSDSRGNPQVVYPLLQQNLHLLDDNFARILYNWATAKLAEVKPAQARSIAVDIVGFSNLIQDFPLGSQATNLEIAITGCQVALTLFTRENHSKNWATLQNNLGNAYCDRIRGERAENMENAIASFQAALEVRTREAFPRDWATLQNNLGTAYFDRIRGERAENIESAIISYQAALEVRTRDAFPSHWAGTQYNLGNAYYQRIRGERAENIETAIASFQAALEVYTRDAFPSQWAMTQHNLGTAYYQRIRGGRAENIETAIISYQAALEVYTRDAFPSDWARTQHNLGNAYHQRIRGEKAENMESAIASYQAALQVRTRDAFPSQWAATQNSLGNAYYQRIRGERAENIETAITSLQAALDVYTRDAFPSDWAMTQNSLGNAYYQRIRGERAENIETAIASYQAALDVYTRDAFPSDWAMTQNNLGIAYSGRIRGERVENIETAIASFQAALDVYTRQAFPNNWAMTQNNLGTAYRNRIRGGGAKNIETAIASFQAALEVYTREALPQNHVTTQFNLGRAYRDAQQWDNAYHAFAAAIDTVESQRVEISLGTANDADKQKLAEEWNTLYRNMIEVCLELANNTQAWEYIERSKTRNLLERLATRNLYPKGKIPKAERHQLQQLRQEIEVEQRRLAADTTPNYTHLNQLRQQYNQLFPFEPIRFNQIQTLLDNQTAIIQWYIFEDCFRAFIITRHNPQPIIWKSSADDLKKLIKWTNAYLRLYYRKNSSWWQHQLESRLEKLADILHIDHILSHIPEPCNQLILVPHLYLHLLPIHALPVSPKTPLIQSRTNPYLLDCFPKGVRYAPSCQLLQQTSHRRQFQHFFGIQNPRRDDPERNLVCADMEVEAIRKHFSSYQILAGSDAKKSALLIEDENTQDIKVWDKLNLAHCLYFSCHGRFNRQSPLDSCLELADSTLTLAEILEHFNLNQCRLVTLSACETGMVDFRRSDEYIGLPNGLLVAGSPSVVSSLWSVNQFSTALLMIKFYEELAKPGNTITIALNEAQRWLRDTTVFGFLDWVKQSQQLSRKWRVSLRGKLSKIETEQGGNATPYKSPDHWAAFCAIGQGV
ncbi:MAG: CHAT domain-containing tetratricopeptide repeat protein [Coleofasciculus sp. B1-GNL1-01]|uniref:CHAT domain-containing protein n=1 Tax=Coleofasciculus sp. B1-GNL1-01 TaxID=3068484 RepID=UPI0032F101BC